jgi:hypothetical protein
MPIRYSQAYDSPVGAPLSFKQPTHSLRLICHCLVPRIGSNGSRISAAHVNHNRALSARSSNASISKVAPWEQAFGLFNPRRIERA